MRWSSALLLGAMGVSSACFAAENIVGETKLKDLEISIYNDNLALVKDSRDVNLRQGVNDVAFEGVARQIKPESVIVFGEGINVLEQNYDYDLLTPQNIIDKSVGREVKTVIENPTTGENIFDTAKIISSNYGSPVLQFSYGIETKFPGRVVFEKLPDSLHSKPTLAAKISSVSAGVRELSLAYLTNGISWKTNYVAKVIDDNTLDLTGWVTINNQSGVDYANARVQLVAGSVNQVAGNGGIMPRAARMMLAKGAVMDMATVESSSVSPSQISGYQLYDLPHKTDIKENQTKQISLIKKDGVLYSKEGRLDSPLYLNGEYQAQFEKEHPSLYYIMTNTEAGNLGLPLPAGIVRFYEDDSNGSMQFIGENSVNHVAKGEKIELNLGQYFNIFVNGKVAKVTKVAEKKTGNVANNCWRSDITRNYDVEVTFNNGGDSKSEVVFVQNIDQDTKIISQNLTGNAKNANQYEWRVKIPANGKTELKFTAQVTSEERQCDQP